MKVRGVPSYNDENGEQLHVPEMSVIPWKLRVAMKAVECWLGSCRPLLVRSRCAERILDDSSPRKAVVALWHSSLIYTLYHFRVCRGSVMTSPSRDGEWIATAVILWGSTPVRGSRLKGGLKAIRKMAGLMRESGFASGVVADGSRGPAKVAQIGAVILARNTGCPIIPTGFAASWAVYFNTWDRLVLPLPFSRVCLVYGDMITVPAHCRGAGVEYYRKKLEDGLNRATAEAHVRLGLPYEHESVGNPRRQGTENSA